MTLIPTDKKDEQRSRPVVPTTTVTFSESTAQADDLEARVTVVGESRSEESKANMQYLGTFIIPVVESRPLFELFGTTDILAYARETQQLGTVATYLKIFAEWMKT